MGLVDAAEEHIDKPEGEPEVAAQKGKRMEGAK